MPLLAGAEGKPMHSTLKYCMQIHRPIMAAAIAAIVLTFIAPPLESNENGETKSMPFSPGERLQFDLRWTLFPAGQAIMHVLPMETIDGEPLYHFRLTARTNAFVDMFYKVRDQIDAYADSRMTHAVQYVHQQHEGDHHKDVAIRFDAKNAIAHYHDGKSRKTTDIQQGTFDPLSVFYYARLSAFKTGTMISSPVSDGKKCVTGQAQVVRRQTIQVAAGRFDTFLIEPDLKHVGGVFEKKKNAKIRLWISADDSHIPVKIASKVAIGSFVGELAQVIKGQT